jgi:hypothetical protein
MKKNNLFFSFMRAGGTTHVAHAYRPGTLTCPGYNTGFSPGKNGSLNLVVELLNPSVRDRRNPAFFLSTYIHDIA